MTVNAAGPYAAEVAAWAGITLPVVPLRRHCFTTEPLSFVHDRLPMIVDMKSASTMHRESGGMLLGLANRDQRRASTPASTGIFWNAWSSPPSIGCRRWGRAGLERLAGLYETTPDHNAVLGPPEGLGGLMLANGFSGHGFMHAPAVGQLIAEWIVDGKPSLDLSPLSLERFSGQAARAEANVI